MNQPTPSPKPRRRLLWVLAGTALLVLVLLGAAVGTITWLLNTPGGLTAIARAVNALAPVEIAIDTPQGSVRRGFSLARLRIRVATIEVDIRDLRATLADFSLRPLRFDFSTLSAAAVNVRVRPGQGGSDEPPHSIASPVAVSAARLQVGEFTLRVGADPDPVTLGARAIDGTVALGPDGYRIERGEFEFGRVDAPLRASMQGSLQGARPFALDARGTLQSNFQDKPLNATLRATGSLERFVAAGDVTSGGASGTFEVAVAAFAPSALHSIHADLRGIDPRVWSATDRQADLRLQADLKPVEGPQFGLAGTVRIDNANPGPLDANRIPARSATGSATWRGDTLTLDNVVAELVRGTARGKFSLTFGAQAAWRADARVTGVDLTALHRRLRPMQVDGDLRAHQAGSDTQVYADLRNRGPIAAALNVDLRVSAERLAINDARLALDRGLVELTGGMALRGNRRINISGSAHGLDPSLLVEGVDARLTGVFALDARLEPELNGDLDFELVDSFAFGRPLAGRGTASLTPAQELALDLDLAVRSARIRASGGLGAPDRTLAIDIDAPALDELALPLKGSVKLQATLRGEWRAPAVDARAQASRLVYGAHTVQTAQATLTYGGGTDGAFALRAEAADHRWAGNPIASLRSATLVAEGRVSEHTVTVQATYDQDQEARLAASGGWSQRRWRGQLTEATAGAPLELRLSAPAALELDAGGVAFGPARLGAAGATVTDLHFELRDQIIATSGRFEDWRPGEYVMRRGVTMIPRGPRESLVLRGAWRLRAADVIDGELNVERVSGDLYATAGSDAPMGVTEAVARATVRANRVEGEAVLRGTRVGTLQTTLAASLERDAQAGWRLAQQRPWRITADADLPSIEWVNSLLSDRMRASVRIGGQVAGKFVIAGTPAKPQADGQIQGSGLRVAWIEQGVRLENGQLATRVSGDELILDELRFAGPPRVKPDDARTAQAMANMEPGFIAATGRLKLPELTGVIQIEMRRLPLLQRVDRWVVATGGANLELAVRRVQFNGAVAADAGFVDFSTPDLPSLSSDVRIIEPSAPPPGEREERVQVGFDLGIDFGRAFYLRGSGLNTRLAGAVRVRSEGRGQIRASGALNTVEGVYEGYGQKLRIRRGRVNFQGPVDNPGLDVLALRTDLPQEAGDIGISITRTAANPLVRLYSDPPLADYQTLSWLVLGRPAEQTGGDNVALARAAVGLLGGSGEGLPSTLARQLGIDEISLRSGQVGSTNSLLPRQSVAGNLRGDTVGTAGSAGAEIVTIGKRLNEALTVSYEQALSGAATVVQLSYQVSRRISLIARAGTENALDVVFSFAFD